MTVCMGCREARAVVKVHGLGYVCESCNEVIDLVFEVEIERVRTACATLRNILDTWGVDTSDIEETKGEEGKEHATP